MWPPCPPLQVLDQGQFCANTEEHSIIPLDPRINTYTDASKAGDDVGFGFGYCVVAEDYFPAKETNVYQAELLAIKEALTWTKKSIDHNRRGSFVIWTDSWGSVGSLEGYQTNDNLMWETLSLI